MSGSESRPRKIELMCIPIMEWNGLLLIPLDVAGNDLPSLPAPLCFPPSTDGGGSGKVCRVLKHFPLFLNAYVL